MVTPDSVRAFYDEFADRVQLRAFIRINRRLVAVRELCRTFIPDGARILEIGCGLGIISRYLSRRASHFVALDISPRNVEIAADYVASPSARFLVADVTKDLPLVRQHGPFDAIVLADVIEHVPLDQHPSVFASIQALLSPTGRIVLTYPSPEYQQFLAEHTPEDLQIIDETVHARNLLSHAPGLTPIYVRYLDVPRTGQYVQVVLQAGTVFAPTGESFLRRAWIRVKSVAWHARNRAFLRRVRRPRG